MKHWILLFLCLLLTACASKSASLPEPVQTVLEVPQELLPEPEMPSEPEEQPHTCTPAAFYALDRSENLFLGPAVVVDSVGNVLLETDGGFVMELWDSEDGQVKAIQWDHRTETVPAADNRISLYDLSGQFLGDVIAGRMELLGDLVILAQPDRAVIYNWAEERMIREDLSNAWTWGSCLIGVPDNAAEALWILDREGQILAEIGNGWTQQEVYTFQGQTYIRIRNSAGFWKILNGQGQVVVEQDADNFVSVSYHHVIYQTGSGYSILDLTTGEVALYWDGTVTEVFEGGAVVWANGWLAVDWNGQPLTPAGDRIQPLLHEETGQPICFLCWGMQGTLQVLEPDGTVRLELPREHSDVQPISAQTGLLFGTMQDPDTGAWYTGYAMVDLTTGALTPVTDHAYSFAQPVWLGGMDTIPHATGMVLAEYPIGDGQYRSAVLQEDGTTLIDGCLEARPGPGGVVVCKTETMQGVLCRDSVWLYQEPIL